MTQSPRPKAFNFGDLSLYAHDNGPSEPAARHNSPTDQSVPPYGTDLPHFRHINRIPIVDVASKIGWQVAHEKIVCPRSDEHKPRTSPYLKVLPSSNKVVCESCDTSPMTVLDMVKDFGGFDTVRDAAEHVANFYPELPRKPKASYLNNPAGERVPAGCLDPWTLLITSGVYSQLSVPSQRLIPILLNFSNWKNGVEERVFSLSNRAMMQYSGIGTFTGISQALTELQAIGFLERLPARRREHSIEKETAAYRVTPLSQRLREFADATVAKFGEAIFRGKAVRRRERQEREYKRMFPQCRQT